jgi:hypothetical protein
MKLDVYTQSHIEAFLLNYELFVKDLDEVAADWSELDEEKRGHHRAELLQVWGNRKVLGQLFQAGNLCPDQEERLAQLDSRLLEQTSLMESCFGFGLVQLSAVFRWGTPLTKSTQTVGLPAVSAPPNYPL